jgi:hypothetical protein
MIADWLATIDEDQPKPDVEDGKSLYRADGRSYFYGGTVVDFEKHSITRETKRGVWIDVYGTPKFVLDGARKRYAYPTKKEALASLIARKRKQIQILQNTITEAHKILEAAEKMEGEI